MAIFVHHFAENREIIARYTRVSLSNCSFNIFLASPLHERGKDLNNRGGEFFTARENLAVVK